MDSGRGGIAVSSADRLYQGQLGRCTALVRNLDRYHDPRAQRAGDNSSTLWFHRVWERAACGLRSMLLPPVSLAALHKLYYPMHQPPTTVRRCIPAGLFAVSSALI
jgi:hypothetical protein